MGYCLSELLDNKIRFSTSVTYNKDSEHTILFRNLLINVGS